MPTPALDLNAYQEVARLVAEHGGVVMDAARAQQQCSPGAFETRAEQARRMGLWGRDAHATAEDVMNAMIAAQSRNSPEVVEGGGAENAEESTASGAVA